MARGRGAASAKPPALGDVLSVIVMLKVLEGLLQSLHASVRAAGSASARAVLSQRLSHHVLSQDLEDIESQLAANGGSPYGNSTSPVNIIRSLATPEAWEQGIGGIIEIPQRVVSSVARLLSNMVRCAFSIEFYTRRCH
jgi:hypothetical protein